ncbi:NADH-quinone oxidoreductase subunit C [Clostridium folliculivorans]|uniref:NADH-quinone oxidoreductase n=1 Tax=Clostridium folliculivorans TaxID=2886038 RepID=A0A9W5Y6N3_9CLOT|nr:NADH-quinone oxidoreductase subunit C [Clostridium folliculivorans]GKU27565.1 NADH-quinone oxidoreductase subunit C [Clostridium folliculivorans]
MCKISEKLILQLKEIYKENIEIKYNRIVAIYIDSNNLLDIVKRFKLFGFDFLVDITAVEEEDLSCIYHFMSLESNELIMVKANLNKKLEIYSISEEWPSADVQEREIYDLFGIEFIGHPNMKRILCPDSFIGHPLRKDFKIPERR